MGVETCISDWTLELNKRFRTQRTLKGREVIRALGGGTPACLYRKHFMNMTRKYKIFFKMQAPDPRQESPYVISAYICQFRKQTPSWLELLVACNDSRQGRSSFSKSTVHLAPPQHEQYRQLFLLPKRNCKVFIREMSVLHPGQIQHQEVQSNLSFQTPVSEFPFLMHVLWKGGPD